jgi:hypothetical protein
VLKNQLVLILQHIGRGVKGRSARVLRARRVDRTFATVTTDPYASLRDQVLQRVLDGPGASDPAVRRAAAENAGLPPDLAPLVEKIHAHAYRVTDDDLARLAAAYGDDALFEVVVSAALGASGRRLRAGLDALERA